MLPTCSHKLYCILKQIYFNQEIIKRIGQLIAAPTLHHNVYPIFIQNLNLCVILLLFM